VPRVHFTGEATSSFLTLGTLAHFRHIRTLPEWSEGKVLAFGEESILKKSGRWTIILLAVAIMIVAAVYFFLTNQPGDEEPLVVEIHPEYGDISNIISTTGVVEPQNRLEIMPTGAGRIDEILVREGDAVVPGQVLAWISSTDRAALLDAARKEGEDSFKYWEEAYKAIPLVSPIKGEVIVRAVEPGQTITSQTVVLVISDRLIVKAQVDETDIGRVRSGQSARISLDAYPEKVVDAVVDHIAYESQLSNNVTTYEVDILPDRVPPVFRSGMSANVEIVEESREGVLTLPREAVGSAGHGHYVMVPGGDGVDPVRREIDTGLSNGRMVEIVSGLTEDDAVLVSRSSYSPSRESRGGNNPLSPFGGSRRRR